MPALVCLDPFSEEVNEGLDVEVITAGFGEDLPLVVLQDVVGLGIDAIGLQGVVGVDLPEALEDLPGIGRHPFVLGQYFLVIRIEGADHVVVAQDLQHLGIGPYAGLHFAAVDASVARKVDEDGLLDLGGIGFGLLEVEESFEPVREVEEIAVFGFPDGGVRRCGRRGKKGHFVIQTSSPEHPVYRILSGDGTMSEQDLLQERKAFGYPPYTRVINLCIKDTQEPRAELMGTKLAGILESGNNPYILTGPYSPAVDKVADNHIRIIRHNLRKDRQLAATKKRLMRTIAEFEQKERYTGHIITDVDPM